MPAITRIANQVKRKDRFSIYIDGKYSFSLSELQISSSDLRVGRELSPEDIAEWQASSDEGKGLDRAYNYLSYRARSRKEVTDYLAKKEYPNEVTRRILDRLEEQKLINDDNFAEGWIMNRRLTSPRSKRQLQQELRQKGLSSEVIDQALSNLGEDEEAQAVSELVQKKRLHQRYGGDEQKVIAYLARQGFSYGLVKRVLSEADED